MRFRPCFVQFSTYPDFRFMAILTAKTLYRMTLWLAVSWLTWFSLAVASFVIHLVWAHNSHQGSHLARCGATWTIFAGALIARPLIRLGYNAWYQASETFDGGEYQPPSEQIEKERQSKIDALNVQILGPCLAVAGTFLWAYGDLLGNWLLACSN